jgi:hypothetical protein
MEAEAERDRRVAVRDHGRRDAERVATDPDDELQAVGEGEHRQKVAMGAEVQFGHDPGAVLVGAAAADSPVRRCRERAVDRQAVLVAVQQR